jgi:hypothetical protein
MERRTNDDVLTNIFVTPALIVVVVVVVASAFYCSFMTVRDLFEISLLMLDVRSHLPSHWKRLEPRTRWRAT